MVEKKREMRGKRKQEMRQNEQWRCVLAVVMDADGSLVAVLTFQDSLCPQVLHITKGTVRIRVNK